MRLSPDQLLEFKRNLITQKFIPIFTAKQLLDEIDALAKMVHDLELENAEYKRSMGVLGHSIDGWTELEEEMQGVKTHHLVLKEVIRISLADLDLAMMHGKFKPIAPEPVLDARRRMRAALDERILADETYDGKTGTRAPGET